MRFSRLVVLAAVSAPVSAFIVPARKLNYLQTTKSRLGQDDDDDLLPSSVTGSSNAIADGESSGVPGNTGKGFIFGAPLAALVAGRQALIARDKIEDEVTKAEDNIENFKKDLRNTNNLISVSMNGNREAVFNCQVWTQAL